MDYKTQEAKKLFKFTEMIVRKGGTINSKFGLQIHPEGARELDVLEDKFKSFSADQAAAIQEAILGSSNVLTICGRAGVGKTYFITSLREILETMFLANVIVCATTGIASQNCGGAGTMHSVFGVAKGNKLPWSEQEEKTEDYKWPRNNAEKIAQKLLGNNSSPLNNNQLNSKLPTYIILDEISMAPSELLHVIYQIALYRHGGGMSMKAASKSVKLICCGDVMQLLPVNRFIDLNGNRKKNIKSREIVNFPWRKAQWDLGQMGLISEPSLLTDGYQHIEGFESTSLALLENHRQNDKEFIEALNYIRLGGKITEGPGRFLLDRLTSKVEPPDHKDVIHIYYSNAEAFERNREVLTSIPESDKRIYPAQVEYKVSGKGKKDEIVKGTVKRFIPREGKTPPKVLIDSMKGELTINADWFPDWANPLEELGLNLPFVVRQNYPSKNVFNGTVGKIVEFRKDGITLELKDGREVNIDKDVCKGVKTDWKGDDEGVYRALPGHIACGLTGHKCIKHDQAVLTKKGYVPIKDIEVGSKVWTGYHWKPVLCKFHRGKAKTFKVTTQNGYVLKCTEDHPLLVSNEEQIPTWKSLSEIRNSNISEYACISARGNIKGNRVAPFHRILNNREEGAVLLKPTKMTDFKGIYERIESITPDGEAEVYDLEIKDDHCFVTCHQPTRTDYVVKGSNLLTPLGLVSVEEISIGDEVWSGYSWKKVTNKICRGGKPTYIVRSESGASLEGTKDTLVLVHKYKESLAYYKSIEELKSLKHSIFTHICPPSLKELDDLLASHHIEDEGITVGTNLSDIYPEEAIVDISNNGFRQVFELEIEKDHCFVNGDGFIVHNCQGLTIDQPLVAHINPNHAKYAAAHWIYVVLSRVVRPTDLYIEGSPSVINQYIKIEPSALEFSKQAEFNMQDRCKGALMAESFTPDDVTNQTPILSSYDLDNSERFTFYFDVFIESDTKISYCAYYSKTEGLTAIYDYDLDTELSPENFDWKDITISKIERFIASLESTQGDLGEN